MTDARDPALDAATIAGAGAISIDARFEVGPLVARGGMGEVYRGTDRRDGSTVAIKRLAPEHRADPDLCARFFSEAEALASLDHPNVVCVRAVGEAEGVPYFVMTWAEGRTLAERVRSDGPLDVASGVAIGQQLLSALAHLHAANLVHRDVKPSNVVVRDDGHCTLLDLGIVRDRARARTETGATLGTPEYMAPEQARDPRRADARSDLYAVGATLYAAWVGAPPYSGATTYELVRQHHEAPVPRPSAQRPELGRGVDRFIARALAKAPSDRFESAEAMAEALGAIERPERRFGWGAVAVLAAGVGLFAWASVRSGAEIGGSDRAAVETVSTTGSGTGASAVAATAPQDGETGDAVVPSESESPREGTGIDRPRARTGTESPWARVRAEPPEGTTKIERPPASTRDSRSAALDGARTTRVDAPANPPPDAMRESATVRIVTLDRGLSTFAVVTIDDLPPRHSPVAGWALPPGEHTLRVERAGFAPVTRRLVLEPGDQRRLTIDLVPLPE